ncbi:MAG: RagB/SusD family nutrient uptake outer membrane protein, partial [Muribaculaceae bacterium]|nr:RagB/SusD family nutrient uptake outer membrane protein [Muribaculaceae bacterium]
MKKSIIYALAASALVLTGCDDFLDKDMRSGFTNNPAFWNNANNVQTYLNSMYGDFSGYGQGGSGGWFYFKSLSDDQANPNFDNWEFTTIPQKSSYWSSSFEEVRRANYMIAGVEASTLTDDEKANFLGIARLYRAWEYWQLVRFYGDIQWLDKVVTSPDDEAVYGERLDRDLVVDKIIEDLDFAIANVAANSSDNAFSKDLARAIKSDVCLFEGTFCKYRTQVDNGKEPNLDRAKKYLNLCVATNAELMGRYSLSENYGDIYNSINLAGNSEVIFYRNYKQDVQGHSTVDYTTGSTAQRGITRDAVEAFLFRDGKPLATTTLDKSDKPELVDGKLSIGKMLSNRDKRLSVIIDPYVCLAGYGWSRDASVGLAEMTSSTGYTVAKYYSDQLGDASTAVYYRQNIGTGYTDAPLFWLAVIYLNDAEARAELGTISQSDLDATINKLMARAELPGLTTTPAADPANNHGVSNLLWEIRRCRRCELMTDNWYRYWDLIRWHQLDKLDSSKYPNINLGANMEGITYEGNLQGGYVVAT